MNTRAAPTHRPSGADRAGWALVWLLVLVHALPYAAGSVYSDTARDLDAAWDVVEGARPLLGPLINDTLHLGPAWFYLLALPMAATKSMSATLLIVGLLAALKFPLAFIVGRRLLDARLGLLWAAALALPGWPSMGQVLAMHVVMVEACSLAVLYTLLRLHRGGAPWWWAVYGALQSLALHAHPATLVLGLLVPIVLWQRRGGGMAREAAWLAVGVSAALLPFVPVLVHEASTGWHAALHLKDYGEAHAPVTALLGAAPLFGGVAMAGPLLLWDGLHGGSLAISLIAAHAVLLGLAATGWLLALRSADGRRQAGRAALACLLMLLGIAALRGRTPWYMAMAWRPWYALLLALGWYWLARWRALVVPALAAAALGLAVATTGMWIAASEAGAIVLRPKMLRDVQAASEQSRSSFMPAWRLDQLGRRLCRHDQAFVLHGDVALAYDSAVALPDRMRCNAEARVGIAGGRAVNDAVHLLGLAPWMLAELGTPQVGWTQALRLQPLTVVASPQTVPVARGDPDVYRSWKNLGRSTHQLELTAPARAAVIINRPFYGYGVVEVMDASADGIVQTPTHQRNAMIVLDCKACTGSDVRWSLRVESGNSDWIDVFVFDPIAVSQ